MQPYKTSIDLSKQPGKIHHGRNSLRSRIAKARGHILHKGYTSIPQIDSASGVQIGMNEATESLIKSDFMPNTPPSNSGQSRVSSSPDPFSNDNMDDMEGSTLINDNMDGSSGWARRSPAPVGAIFVHAGAGYHSTTNEHIHLGACADAAKVAMRVLRGGGSAVEAVEAAIRVLEDKEITNAGYGSNLTIEGVVECDATVVDHLGRSGACGAVAKIKNPIHLARVILEQSSRPLSLRRVPPNLLIADGAAEFGWEHGIDLVPHAQLVSKNAHDRFLRWRQDLIRAGGTRIPGTPNSMGSGADEPIDHDFEEKYRAKQRRDHTNALIHGTYNEGQPDSPMQVSTTASPAPPEAGYFLGNNNSQPNSKKNSRSSSPVTGRDHSSPSSRSPAAKRPRFGGSQSSDGHATRVHSLLGVKGDATTSSADPFKTPQTDSVPSPAASFAAKHKDRRTGGSHDGSADDSDYYEISHPIPSPLKAKAMPPYMLPGIDEDLITDTVGAIAIDMFGNIAAGSSSGGIGMKHRGRVGPAALVGVGTAVIPVDFEDSDNKCVAAVTSGTGEHMATTMASQKCAERLYFSTKRGRGGTNTGCTDEEAMDSFVLYDFMDHPGVKNSHSAGAIGVMAVKKTDAGYFLHFAHNTDSFALASMHSGEKEPKCVMSRLGDYGNVVQGGRKIRME